MLLTRLYSGDQIREDEINRACACMCWLKRNACRGLVGKPEGRGPLRRPKHRWEDIGVDIKEIEWEGMGWIHVA